MEPRAIYGGSFDPFHHGHLDLIERTASLFGSVLVAVGSNVRKRYLFGIDERVEMVRLEVGSIEGVTVESFTGLLVEVAHRRGCRANVRGLRTPTDYAYEQQMAAANHDLMPDLETVCLLARPELAALSSSLVREIAFFAGDVSKYVSPGVAARLAARVESLGDGPLY